MYNKFSQSVFVSQFDAVKEKLSDFYSEGDFVFTSLHIAEEFDDTYKSRCENMCSFLNSVGYTIIADVSKRTLDYFGETSIVNLAKKLHISVLRLDFGFDIDEIRSITQEMPVCLNASTLDTKTISALKKNAKKIYAMHNYYPRPETGLDEVYFSSINERLIENDIEVFSFIQGDILLRAPLQQGLPTLEKHRGVSPYAAFVDMMLTHKVSAIFVGDGIISKRDYAFIRYFLDTGLLTLPIKMEAKNIDLYEKVFTVRDDSPYRIMRLLESREYATKGTDIEVYNTVDRNVGCVTIDNERYGRYSGEIQIVRENLKADEKVNVIARVPSEYHLLLKHCKKLRFFAY